MTLTYFLLSIAVALVAGFILLYHKAPFSRIRKFKAKRAQKHDIKRYSLDAGVPRICINEETGKDTVTVRAEFKNFEKDPITISWAKCCVPLASLNFTELESHEPIVIAPLGSRHIEFEATLTPNMVEKAKEKFGSDN